MSLLGDLHTIGTHLDGVEATIELQLALDGFLKSGSHAPASPRVNQARRYGAANASCGKVGGPSARRQRVYGNRQMSKTPLVECELALPSGTAIRPSATIGLFQCPPPLARLATRLPVAGSYTRSAP